MSTERRAGPFRIHLTPFSSTRLDSKPPEDGVGVSNPMFLIRLITAESPPKRRKEEEKKNPARSLDWVLALSY